MGWQWQQVLTEITQRLVSRVRKEHVAHLIHLIHKLNVFFHSVKAFLDLQSFLIQYLFL